MSAQGTSALSDAALFRRTQRDDERALGELFWRYGKRLATIAYAVLGSDDLAADVIQDVFVTLWEQRAKLEITDNVAGYLYRAVRNRALNVLRHENTERRLASDWADTDLGPASVSNAAEQSLDAADLKARIYASLRHVPPSPREVFLLRWEHDLSYEEIAAIIDATVPTVRQLMYRATQRLARRYRRD